MNQTINLANRYHYQHFHHFLWAFLYHLQFRFSLPSLTFRFSKFVLELRVLEFQLTLRAQRPRCYSPARSLRALWSVKRGPDLRYCVHVRTQTESMRIDTARTTPVPRGDETVERTHLRCPKGGLSIWKSNRRFAQPWPPRAGALRDRVRETCLVQCVW